MEQIEYQRPCRNESDHVVHVSKCGRVRIEKRHYTMPFSVDYYHVWVNGKLVWDDAETLKEAKEIAHSEIFDA